MKKLLTPLQVREALSVSQDTLYRWSSKGIHLKPVKIGGQNRYRESDLNDFINGQDEGDGRDKGSNR